MINKWLWLTIGVVVVVGLVIMAIAGRYSAPKQAEIATPPRPAPAPRPLTFQERKEQGLLTPEEQRIVGEVEKMKAANREYENKRQIRLAREEAEKAAAYKRAATRSSRPVDERAVFSDMADAELRYRSLEDARQAVGSKHGISQDRLLGISVKGVQRGWSMPPPPPPAETWVW